MKYLSYKEFEKANMFGLGSLNEAYAQYFTGNSFLNPLTNPKKQQYFWQISPLSRAAETTGIFITQKAEEDSF